MKGDLLRFVKMDERQPFEMQVDNMDLKVFYGLNHG